MIQCLLIEYEPCCRLLLKAVLEACYCRVKLAETPLDAQRVFAQGSQFDVVLFDGSTLNQAEWDAFAADTKHTNRMICTAARPSVANRARIALKREVEYCGKNVDILEELVLGPLVVRV